MHKKYLVVFMSIMFGAHLHAYAPELQINNPLVVSENAKLKLIQKLRSNGMLLELQRTNNDQTTSVFIAPEAVPDVALKQGGAGAGLKSDFREIQQRSFWWGEVPAEGISLFVAWGLEWHLLKWVMDKSKSWFGFNYQKPTYGHFRCNVVEGLLKFIFIKKLTEHFVVSRFKKWHNSKRYLKQLKNINFDDSPVVVLKVPNEFIKAAISYLEREGFQLI